MPIKTRKRKAKKRSKKRKASSRKRARRPASRPRISAPSSDEDFVVDSDGEESEAEEETTDDDDDEEEEEEEEEEDNEKELDSFCERTPRHTQANQRATRRPDNSLDIEFPRPRHTGGRGHNQVSTERGFDADGDVTEGAGEVAIRSSFRAGDPSQRHTYQMRDTVLDSLKHVATEISDTPQQGGYGSSRSNGHVTESSSQASKQHEMGFFSGDAEAERRKGKNKVLEGAELPLSKSGDEGAVVCGICLTERDLVERGKLDCCDHFYCFGCIMEWAKVESRCPMCKQRFVTIVKSGTNVSKRMRTVRIPLRNQVYIPEDEDLPVEDPYADVVCMECHGTGDEGLLLLCDRCDSAAHTFCVGLGRSVPRGDWFCRDCQALTVESSSNEEETEELVLPLGSEDEALLRSIVASVDSSGQRRRQTRAQRALTSTTRELPARRRRVRSGSRRRLWQLLSGRRMARPVAAPRLPVAARAFLSIVELNHANQVSEASQNGSARTVPQQRRMHERIHVIRNNWNRIQTGDLQFEALGAQATAPSQPSPLPCVTSAGSNTIAPESSTPGNVDLERAWRMMNHAQSFSAGIKTHLQNSAETHQMSTVCARQQTAQPNSRASNNVPHPSKSVDIHAHSMSPSSFSNEDAGINRCTMEAVSKVTSDKLVSSQEESLRGAIQSRECTKQEPSCTVRCEQMLPPPKLSLDCDRGSHGPVGSACREQKVNLVKNVFDRMVTGSVGEMQEAKFVTDGTGTKKATSSVVGSDHLKATCSSHAENHHPEGTQNHQGHTNMVDNHVISGVRENGVPKRPAPSCHEDLKVHLTELVKKQIWPVYIAEGLDKEQFKRIARAAVHSLLALFDPVASLSCSHLEDHGKSPVSRCCGKCLDQHVDSAVKTAVDKVLSHERSNSKGL